ncbi:hypothetical protein Tco_0627373 [Tanacetum coccineum]|uniref:Uncharacterized protein n=1 Tax=Tanacetum coccineum TaxID=301880 RepID=A0ABQ4WM89_9ASTR
MSSWFLLSILSTKCYGMMRGSIMWLVLHHIPMEKPTSKSVMLIELIKKYDDSSDEEFEIQRIWLCTFTDTEAARAAICFPNSHALSEVISSR